MEVFTDYFHDQDQPWTTVDWNLASDQVPFVEEDVAVGGLFTGGGEEGRRCPAGTPNGSTARQAGPAI